MGSPYPLFLEHGHHNTSAGIAESVLLWPTRVRFPFRILPRDLSDDWYEVDHEYQPVFERRSGHVVTEKDAIVISTLGGSARGDYDAICYGRKPVIAEVTSSDTFRTFADVGGERVRVLVFAQQYLVGIKWVKAPTAVIL